MPCDSLVVVSVLLDSLGSWEVTSCYLFLFLLRHEQPQFLLVVVAYSLQKKSQDDEGVLVVVVGKECWGRIIQGRIFRPHGQARWHNQLTRWIGGILMHNLCVFSSSKNVCKASKCEKMICYGNVLAKCQ